jgi:ferric-dicitrate binding protein FerR (iron transport regulator)
MNSKNTPIEWKLFRKALESKLSPEEQAALDRWLQASPENKSYFHKAKAFFQSFENTDEIYEADHQKAWEAFKKYAVKKQRIIHFPWLRVAAVVAGIGISSYILLTQFKQQTTSSFSDQTIIEPGRSLAKLTLEDGSVIYLEQQDTLISLQGEKSRVAIDSGRLAYIENDREQNLIPVKNKVDIPHGGEYIIILTDGTKVWLNSESTLEYTVPFEEDKREVTLQGEAYFEVAPDVTRPFTVKTNKMNIRVLGTHFNVTAYKDENTVKTTLVEGSVEVSPSITHDPVLLSRQSFSHMVLKPGQQASINDKGELKINDVNIDLYTAWTQGYFVFENEPLSLIFHKLSRWYDIEVLFKGTQAENELFSGKLPRFENFGVLLEMIRKVSKVEIKMDEKTIIIN